MISKTKLTKRIEKKNNSVLVNTLKECKKNEDWMIVGKILSCPTRKRKSINLSEIEEGITAGEKIVFPGKILSQGEMKKKVKIIALNFSEQAKEKLSQSGCEFDCILEEIKKNPKCEGLRILE